jgi:hypothetical protein
MEVLEHSVISLSADDLRRRVLIDRHKASAPRTSGVHLSGILKYLAYSPGGALDDPKKRQSEPSDFEETYPTIVACGHMWEEFCVSLYPDMIWQPGEMSRDDIYGTADGITFDLEVLPKSSRAMRSIKIDCNEEFKFTTKGTRSPQDVWWWQRQALGYCAMNGVQYTRWHVLWAHGGYQGKRWEHFPTYTRTLVGWTEEEIEKWWKVLVSNKGKATKE